MRTKEQKKSTEDQRLELLASALLHSTHPDCINAQGLQVIELVQDALEIAKAVAVRIVERGCKDGSTRLHCSARARRY